MRPFLFRNGTDYLRGNMFVELVRYLFIVGHGARGSVSSFGYFVSFELTVRFFCSLSVFSEMRMKASVMVFVFCLFFVGGQEVLFGCWSFCFDSSFCE